MDWKATAEVIKEIAPFAGFASIFVALVALRNVRLTSKSLKQAYWYGEITESVRQSERYIEKFLPLFRQIDSELKNMGYPDNSWPKLRDLQGQNLEGDSEKFQGIKDILNQNVDFRGKLFDALNQLELVAMSFVTPIPHRHASLLSAREIAFRPMALSFCESCDRLGIFVAYVQHTKYTGLYSNIVQLYEEWVSEVERKDKNPNAG